MNKNLAIQYYENHKGKLLQYLGPDQNWLGVIGKIQLLNGEITNPSLHDTLYIFQNEEKQKVLSNTDFFEFVQFLKPVA